MDLWWENRVEADLINGSSQLVLWGTVVTISTSVSCHKLKGSFIV